MRENWLRLPRIEQLDGLRIALWKRGRSVGRGLVAVLSVVVCSVL